MGCQKSLGCCTGMIPCPIMDEKQGLCGVIQDHLQEPLVTFRVKPTLDALIKQAPREILNGAKYFVAFALATRGDLRLVPTLSPRVAQRAPLGKTGFIFKEDQAFTPLGSPEEHWPFVLEPGQTLGCVEMVRDKTRLLKRKAQVMQQRTHILAIVEDAKLAPDQHAEEDRGPTGGLTAHHEWTGLNELNEAFFLPRRQLRSATTTMVINQTVHSLQHKGLTPLVETGGAEAPSFTEYLHWHLVYQQVEQHRGASYQPYVIALIGVLQAEVEVFDGGATELYPHTHGCVLLWGCLVCAL